MVWKFNVHFSVQVADTLVCVAAMIKGVPFGTHTAWLSMSNTGMPIDVTRVEAVSQLAVRQGCGLPPGVTKVHPEMM